MANAIRHQRNETAETLGRYRLDNAARPARTLAELDDDQLEEVLDKLRVTVQDLDDGPVRTTVVDFGMIAKLD